MPVERFCAGRLVETTSNLGCAVVDRTIVYSANSRSSRKEPHDWEQLAA